jgi:hypothetical protein
VGALGLDLKRIFEPVTLQNKLLAMHQGVCL